MSDAGFLGRWSRRKRAALAEPHAPAPAPAPPGEPLPAHVPVPQSTPAAFDPGTLPPVDTLTAASEIRDFLRDGVPAALRQAALRRVWALDPAIAGFIGPADYAWDFNAPDGMAGFAQSMPADLGRMLAQAIGLEEPANAAADRPGEALATPADALAPAAETPLVVAVEVEPPGAAAAGAVLRAQAEPGSDAATPAEIGFSGTPRRHGAATPV